MVLKLLSTCFWHCKVEFENRLFYLPIAFIKWPFLPINILKSCHFSNIACFFEPFLCIERLRCGSKVVFFMFLAFKDYVPK